MGKGNVETVLSNDGKTRLKGKVGSQSTLVKQPVLSKTMDVRKVEIKSAIKTLYASEIMVLKRELKNVDKEVTTHRKIVSKIESELSQMNDKLRLATRKEEELLESVKTLSSLKLTQELLIKEKSAANREHKRYLNAVRDTAGTWHQNYAHQLSIIESYEKNSKESNSIIADLESVVKAHQTGSKNTVLLGVNKEYLLSVKAGKKAESELKPIKNKYNEAIKKLDKLEDKKQKIQWAIKGYSIEMDDLKTAMWND